MSDFKIWNLKKIKEFNKDLYLIKFNTWLINNIY